MNINLNRITKVQLIIIMNDNLYKKKIIDENTYSRVNEKLLKLLKELQIN